MERRSDLSPFDCHSEEVAGQLEQLWQQDQPPELKVFLAHIGELSPAELVVMLRIDQKHRWKRGERVNAESYLSAWPSVNESNGALELICAEFILRQSLGETPLLEEYLQRFPAYAAQLRQQLQLCVSLSSENIN